MKKPKDIAELASRLSSAASTPLVAPAAPDSVAATTAEAPAPKARAAKPDEDTAARPATSNKPRRQPNRQSVSVFLRLSQTLYEQYDREAVRRTKETGRGVTVQQVILDQLEARA